MSRIEETQGKNSIKKQKRKEEKNDVQDYGMFSESSVRRFLYLILTWRGPDGRDEKRWDDYGRDRRWAHRMGSSFVPGD
jgi:hypothetical protein